MSEGQLPAYVDTRKVFLQEADVAGQVALERLPRFLKVLVNDQALVEVVLKFARGIQGRRQITGELNARAQVTCERCLEPVEIELSESIQLVLLESESEAATLEPDWDPWLSDHYKLQLAELIDEQVILALPIVNLHAEKDCIEALGYQQPAEPEERGSAGPGDEENPFAVLKALKQNAEEND
jgi:uncharacterized protein